MELELQSADADLPVAERGGSLFSGMDVSDRDVAMIRGELDAYFRSMQRFGDLEPDQILMVLSSYSARIGELRLQLIRRDTRRSNALRCKEIDPFIEECDRQFKIWSRIVAIREMDFRLSGGQV